VLAFAAGSDLLLMPADADAAIEAPCSKACKRADPHARL